MEKNERIYCHFIVGSQFLPLVILVIKLLIPFEINNLTPFVIPVFQMLWIKNICDAIFYSKSILNALLKIWMNFWSTIKILTIKCLSAFFFEAEHFVFFVYLLIFVHISHLKSDDLFFRQGKAGINVPGDAPGFCEDLSYKFSTIYSSQHCDKNLKANLFLAGTFPFVSPEPRPDYLLLLVMRE